MKRNKRIGILAIGLLIITSLNQCKVTQEKDLNLQLDSYFKQVYNQPNDNKPGFSVIITREDSIFYKANFGYADLAEKTQISEYTVFDIASLSKQFTGVAIALLEEKGEINIDDKIIKYLPDLPEAMSDITIYQLVHHTSGIRDWPSLFALKGWQPEEPLSFEDIYQILRKQESLNFIPGTEYSYSNSNYNLLAKIIEVVTGTSFESWVHDNIFIQLGMENTYYADNNNSEENVVAKSYIFDGDDYVPFSNNLSAPGSSSIMSSTIDISKWLVNFSIKTLGGDGVFNLMTQKGNLTNSKTIGYGYGLNITEIANKEAFVHNGAWGGYRSGIAYFTEESVSVVVLSNNGRLYPKKIINDLAVILFDNKKGNKVKDSELTEQEIDDEFFALCAGKYQQVDDKNCYLTFFKEGDEYFLSMYNRTAKLYAKSDSVFFIKEAKAEFVFHLKNGKVSSHTLRQSGRSYKANKVEEGKKDANINYNKLVGTYFSKELDVEYLVKYENNELKIHSEIFPVDIILENKEDLSFKCNSALMQSILFLEEKGEITSLVINNPRAKNIKFEMRN